MSAAPSTRSFLSFSAFMVLFASAIWGDFITYCFNVEFSQELFLGFAALIAVLCLLTCRTTERPPLGSKATGAAVAIVCAFFCIVVVALARGYPLKDCTLAYAPCVAVLFALLDRRSLRVIVLITLITSISVQIVEVISGRFTYVWLREGFAIDERLVGGATGVFRSKGLFAGPTSATAYAILCALLLPRLRIVVVLVLGVAVMSGSKAGILFAGVYLAMWAVLGRRRERPWAILTMLAGLASIGLLYLTQAIDVRTMERIIETKDIEAAGNAARFYFWDAAWSAFVNEFSVIQQLLGWPRGSREVFGNSTESQYLQILLDLGIVGLSVYLVSLVLVARRIRIDCAALPAFVGFSVVGAVTPLFDQAGLCILSWIFIYHMLMFPSRSGRSSAFTGVRETLASLTPARRVASAEAARSRPAGDAAAATARRTGG